VKQVSEMGIPFTAYTDSLIVQVNIGER
jgi:hypothetical protein